MYRVLLGLLFTTVVAECAADTGNYSKIEDYDCFGWYRSGIMTEAEESLFQELNAACLAEDIDTLNALLDIPANSLEVKCSPSIPVFIEPQVPEIALIIRNVADKPLALLELEAEPIAIISSGAVTHWFKDFYISPVDYPRHVRILKPGDTHRFVSKYPLEGYGDHRIRFQFSAGLKFSRAARLEENSEEVQKILRLMPDINWAEVKQHPLQKNRSDYVLAECKLRWESDA